ncbi:DUF3298 and DUF4163 domain-containing protein [Christiangramia sp. SM2212]|uniref:DUF3298 and DUF4163 domain-containing protein n=1 Tax=Christiangramia sediminicola TaxID=3073267 RepID=A0ABU1ES46_9FLAO|nr:DUF3298 and DUF4163 domain-containing protein [Christiangramia sp. SM2212]MDR5591224.1 DUF3298 and DUF4163 domain-containing protein [Christiangramia sp. SM2212]
MKRILWSFMLVLLCMACADDKKENEENLEKELAFSTKTIEKRLDDCEPEKGECTFISLIFPVAENQGKVSENINREIENFLVNTIDYQDDITSEKPEQLAENFLKNYQETALKFPDYELPWEVTINGKVAYKTEKLISIKFNSDIFTGGAHGYRSTRYLNFKAENGKLLKAEDLFTSEFKDFVEKDFRIKQEIPQDENINSTGLFFEDDEFHLPLNIGITEETVILHYNAYEIAPYSAGNFILSYSRNEIKEFLKLKNDEPKA